MICHRHVWDQELRLAHTLFFYCTSGIMLTFSFGTGRRVNFTLWARPGSSCCKSKTGDRTESVLLGTGQGELCHSLMHSWQKYWNERMGSHFFTKSASKESSHACLCLFVKEPHKTQTVSKTPPAYVFLKADLKNAYIFIIHIYP